MCGFALQICLLFPDWAKLDPSLCPQSDDCICQAQNLRRCPAHTNTHANTITSSIKLPCAHMLLQASKLTHTQTHTQVLKRNKNCRAGWSSPRFLSESFIFAPQQESRHHNSHPRYSTAVPTMEGKKETSVCFCMLRVCLSGPLHGQTVVLCGPKESFVPGRRLFKLEWM